MNKSFKNISLYNNSKTTILRLILYIILISHTIIVFFPIYIMFMTSIKNNKELFTNQVGLPKTVIFDNIINLFKVSNFVIYFRNSIFVTLSTILLLLIVSTLAAYALAKYSFILNRVIYFYFLAGLMIPIRLGTINIVQIMQKLHLYDNLLALILVYTTMSIPIGIFVLTDFIKLVPEELSQAARIDGCSEFKIFINIIIPLIRPALVTVAIFNFIPTWNDFWFALILLKSDNLRTVPLAVTLFFGEHSTQWGLVFSALSLASIPVMLFYLILSRQFIKGLTSGALKG